jgi:2,3-bisphosphoglycerate-independent phosphoglycerate mutase
MKRSPLVLLILDGFGLAPAGPGNAVTLACTPNIDRLMAEYPHARLKCSGRDVGLPKGFMGNSEVGHMNIGAGRVVYQDLTRIDMAIEDHSLSQNPVLGELAAKVKSTGGKVHLMGLLSDGGVHSHQDHLKALLEFFRDQGLSKLYVHAFMDGRDTPPLSGQGYLEHLEKVMKDLGAGAVASIMGRFYAMDRDKHWERVEQAYAALTSGQGQPAASAAEAIARAYQAGETDEFVKPRLITGQDGKPLALIEDEDAVFFFNFRADRAREITRAFILPGFTDFPRGRVPNLASFATMTEYDSSFRLPTAFKPEEISHTLGQVFSLAGLKQLRLAETEKYAHVTYFLNGGQEEPFPGEDRLLVPSPRDVATYDLKPQMSVLEVTRLFEENWGQGVYDLMVLNLANPDMVGHTGVLAAAVAACEVVDQCVGRIAKAVLDGGGRLLLTADHGNAEEMIDAHGGKMTAHTVNEVPVLLAGLSLGQVRLHDGRLADIAPTILELTGLPKPKDMTGQSLIEAK